MELFVYIYHSTETRVAGFSLTLDSSQAASITPAPVSAPAAPTIIPCRNTRGRKVVFFPFLKRKLIDRSIHNLKICWLPCCWMLLDFLEDKVDKLG